MRTPTLCEFAGSKRINILKTMVEELIYTEIYRKNIMP